MQKMTSTQRSESANHMLKSYMPPASPMHVFVRQYMRLQFDRERNESYEEKRTMIVNMLLPFKKIDFCFLLISAQELISFILILSLCQGGAVRQANLAIERHASKIYTRNMFEEFGRLLIEGTAYNVTEVERMRKYITTHNNAAKREKWSRVE